MRKGSLERLAAFTLVELMLVVIIIGILAAVMVPRLAGKTRDARIAAAKVDIASLCAALDSFEVDVGRFPSTGEGLEALMTRPGSLATGAQWDGPYLRELARDPWGNEYQYRYPGEVAVDYDVWSYGPDGQEGGEDDIWNVRTQPGDRD